MPSTNIRHFGGPRLLGFCALIVLVFNLPDEFLLLRRFINTYLTASGEGNSDLGCFLNVAFVLYASLTVGLFVSLVLETLLMAPRWLSAFLDEHENAVWAGIGLLISVLLFMTIKSPAEWLYRCHSAVSDILLSGYVIVLWAGAGSCATILVIKLVDMLFGCNLKGCWAGLSSGAGGWTCSSRTCSRSSSSCSPRGDAAEEKWNSWIGTLRALTGRRQRNR